VVGLLAKAGSKAYIATVQGRASRNESMRAMRLPSGGRSGVTTTLFLKDRRDFETVAGMVFTTELSAFRRKPT